MVGIEPVVQLVVGPSTARPAFLVALGHVPQRIVLRNFQPGIIHAQPVGQEEAEQLQDGGSGEQDEDQRRPASLCNPMHPFWYRKWCCLSAHYRRVPVCLTLPMVSCRTYEGTKIGPASVIRKIAKRRV